MVLPGFACTIGTHMYVDSIPYLQQPALSTMLRAL